MKILCPSCRAVMASEDRRYKPPKLTLSRGVQMLEKDREAPSIKCVCGKRTILLKGQL